MENPFLEVRHAVKRYATHTALNDVSISVPRGKVFGLLGPNGAGKTTLIRIINRITAPDSGEVRFDGHPLQPDDVMQIGYLPEERGLYKKMKVGEQAIYLARLKGLSNMEATQRLRHWFEKFDIMPWWNKKLEELSKGMQQKVQFIITVVHEPPLLIFDEPFSGFDPINAGILKREILRLRDQGATVIFSTHNMGSVEELCDEITLINKSHNILSGNVRDIREAFGNNTYELGFVGSPESLTALPFAAELAGLSPEGTSLATVSLPTPADVRAFLGAANQAVQVASFRRMLPSMDNIFVQAVEASNSQNAQQ